MDQTQATLQCQITIDAAPAALWDLISDVRRLARWSPQVDSTRLRDEVEQVGLGVQFTNRNVAGPLAWITHGEIVRFDPERELAFRIAENWVVWSFVLTPLADGNTRLTHTRLTPEGISPQSQALAQAYLGGVEAFTAAMLTGMATTVAAIKAEAEQSQDRG